MDGQIALEVMDERLQRLQAALNRDQLAFNQASVGRRCDVLVERKGKLPGQMLGKSPWLQSVHFDERGGDRRHGRGRTRRGRTQLAGGSCENVAA